MQQGWPNETERAAGVGQRGAGEALEINRNRLTKLLPKQASLADYLTVLRAQLLQLPQRCGSIALSIENPSAVVDLYQLRQPLICNAHSVTCGGREVWTSSTPR